MLDRFRTLRLRIAFAALYALAMVFVGYAHRPVGISSIDLAQAEAYALPGGLANALCLPGTDEGATHLVAPCDACLVASAPGLGAAPAAELAAPNRLVVAAARIVLPVPAAPVRYAPTSRGPPGLVASA